MAAEDIHINYRMGEYGTALLPDSSTALNYCNAGALATAGHGTALGVICSARDQGKEISIIACETKPFLQGARLTAWEMVQERIPVTLITDNIAGHFMSQDAIHAIVVGGQTGSQPTAMSPTRSEPILLAVLAARAWRLVLCGLCPLSTIDLATASGGLIPIEECAAEEVLVIAIAGGRWQVWRFAKSCFRCNASQADDGFDYGKRYSAGANGRGNQGIV